MVKSKLVKDLTSATASSVQQLRDALVIGLDYEARRLFDDHRAKFHSEGYPSCIICRSLRRTIVRSVPK